MVAQCLRWVVLSHLFYGLREHRDGDATHLDTLLPIGYRRQRQATQCYLLSWYSEYCQKRKRNVL